MSYYHAMIRNISSEEKERRKEGGKGRVDWGQLGFGSSINSSDIANGMNIAHSLSFDLYFLGP